RCVSAQIGIGEADLYPNLTRCVEEDDFKIEWRPTPHNIPGVGVKAGELRIVPLEDRARLSPPARICPRATGKELLPDAACCGRHNQVAVQRVNASRSWRPGRPAWCIAPKWSSIGKRRRQWTVVRRVRPRITWGTCHGGHAVDGGRVGRDITINGY